MARYEVSYGDVQSLAETIGRFGDIAEDTINEYFEGEAFQRITPHIQGLIHASGRTFKGHPTSATAASVDSVFGKETPNLEITIKSKGRFGYLYFPDDGSNTSRHAGEQHFMLNGAEAALPDVTEDIAKRLTQHFEEA